MGVAGPVARRRRLSSVRSRASLGAVAVVGVALLGGSFAFVGLLDSTLTEGLVTTAEVDTAAVVQQLEAAAGERGERSLAVAWLEDVDDDDRVLQLLDDRGRVVGGSAGADDVTLPEVDDDTAQVRLDDDDHLVVSEPVDLGDSEYELRAAYPLEDVDDAVDAAAGLLLVAVPLALAVVGLTTWLVVGRALRPVERIRREVDAIGGADLDRRVPVPDTRDEIHRLARTMNGMLERLDRSHRAQQQFVSDASHELRSPIASIRQYAELERDHPGALPDGELVSVVLAEGLRLQDLVESLLLLTRLDERAVVVQRRPVDLDDVVLAEVRRLRDTTALVVDAAGIAPARVLGDERMLARVVRNIVDNAARHATGRVALGVSTAGATVELTVDDDGPGVPEADRSRVFDRFVRLDDARARDVGGSGLGLAIVADVVRAHGGRVNVSASPLGGARFVVTLPAADDA